MDTPVELELDPTEVSVFEEARRLGVHRTVHAGEAGPPGAVTQVCMMLLTYYFYNY